MLNKNLILLFIPLLLCSCLSTGSAEKLNVKGERISIITQDSDIKPDLLLKSSPVVLPKQINYTDWPQSGVFADKAPLHLSLNNIVKEAWEKSIGSSLGYMQSFISAPIVFNDTIYSLNINNELIALNAKTGKKLWDLKLKSEYDKRQRTLVGSLAVDGKTLIATLTSGELYAINTLTHSVEWKKKLNEAIHSSPVFKDGLLFVKAVNNKLFALNIKTGEIIWDHEGVHETFALQGNSAPAISANNIVIVSYSNNDVYALNAANGQELWSKSLTSMYSFEFSREKPRSVSAPVIVKNKVYIVDNQGELKVFDLLSGVKLWSSPIKVTGRPWVAGNSIFVVTDNNQLICLFALNGKTKWVTDLNKTMLQSTKHKENSSFTAPILAGNRLFIASNKGILGTFNPQDGSLNRFTNIKQNVSVSPIIVNKMVYFLTDSSNIIAYK